MPSATKTLFVKRVVDFQKLLFNIKLLEVRNSETFFQKGFWPPEALNLFKYFGAVHVVPILDR